MLSSSVASLRLEQFSFERSCSPGTCRKGTGASPPRRTTKADPRGARGQVKLLHTSYAHSRWQAPSSVVQTSKARLSHSGPALHYGMASNFLQRNRMLRARMVPNVSPAEEETGQIPAIIVEKHQNSGLPPGGKSAYNVDVEEEFLALVEERAKNAGSLVQGKATNVTEAVAARAIVIRVSILSRAEAAQQNLLDKAQGLQERATDAGTRVQERASGLAERLHDQQQALEKAVQEKALQVEKKLPPSTQKALRASASRAQNFVATVGQAIDTLPVTRTQLAWLLTGVFIILKLAFEWWHHSRLDARGSSGFDLPESSRRRVPEPPPPPAPVALMFAQPDLRRKEPVEWLNMILSKVFRIYRKGLELWMVNALQPSLDEMEKPDWVQRVRITQFFLGDEPPVLRTIERRTSRRSNDLQYHVGFRYTGEMRMTIEVPLKIGNALPVTIPVGVRDIDIDAELWLKLKLIPVEPWVGTMTWAFVTLPKIKLTLAPFRILNLMAIPFLSQYLLRLFTEELPARFVRPNYKVVDLLKNRKPPAPVPSGQQVFRDFKKSEVPQACRTFSGELQVTLIAAQYLPVFPYVVSDPYVTMELGDQIVRSKKNSETSIIGPRGAPIWNQDFQLLVINQVDQTLIIRVRDTLGPLTVTLGTGDLRLRSLQDTIPLDLWVPLKAGLPPFYEIQQGEVKLRVTYKEYVDDEEELVDEPVVETVGEKRQSALADMLELQSFARDISDMAFIEQLSGLFLEGTEQSISAVSDLVKLGQDLAKGNAASRDSTTNGEAAAPSRVPYKVFPGMQKYFEERRRTGLQSTKDPESQQDYLKSLEKLLPQAMTKEMVDFLKQLEARRKQDGLKIDLSSIQDIGILAFFLEMTRTQRREGQSEQDKPQTFEVVDLPPEPSKPPPPLQRLNKWAKKRWVSFRRSLKP